MDDVATFYRRDEAFRRHERSFRRIFIQLSELESRDLRFTRSRKDAECILRRAESSNKLARQLAELTGYKDDFQLWEESLSGKHGDVWNEFRTEVEEIKSDSLMEDIESILRSMEVAAAQEDYNLLLMVEKLRKGIKSLTKLVREVS